MSSRATVDNGHERSYLPALRWHVLTPAYDLVVRITSGERRVKRRLLDHAHVEAGERVLDVGCGTGTLLAAVADRTPGAVRCGVDRDPEMLRRAVPRVGDSGLCVGDGRWLPLASGSVDVVLSSLFFHHLLDSAKDEVFHEVARVLSPGGRLAIADWGAPRSRLARAGSTVVRAFDGAASTRANFAGCLPEIVGAAGFAEVETRERLVVPLGTVDIITATAARAELS